MNSSSNSNIENPIRDWVTPEGVEWFYAIFPLFMFTMPAFALIFGLFWIVIALIHFSKRSWYWGIYLTINVTVSFFVVYWINTGQRFWNIDWFFYDLKTLFTYQTLAVMIAIGSVFVRPTPKQEN